MQRTTHDLTPQIIVYDGSGEETMFRFDSSKISIGRGPQNRLQILDQSISQTHIEIEPTDCGRYILSDLNSTNGTFLNGRLVSYEPLASGDIICVGGSTYLQFTLLSDTLAEESSFEAEIQGLAR